MPPVKIIPALCAAVRRAALPGSREDFGQAAEAEARLIDSFERHFGEEALECSLPAPAMRICTLLQEKVLPRRRPQADHGPDFDRTELFAEFIKVVTETNTFFGERGQGPIVVESVELVPA